MDVKAITAELKKGVQDVFTSDRYLEYLDCMSKFHDYSLNNCILIFMQKPDATMIAGYQAWKNKFNRQVKKGEHGITILAPCPHKMKKMVADENGNEVEREIRWTTFRAVRVFDVSQTEGKELPSICPQLSGSVEDFKGLFSRLSKATTAEVDMAEMNVNGAYSPQKHSIRIKAGMSEAQTIKTLVHEIAHSKLHCTGGEYENADRGEKEVQAESVAYTVCKALGIDADGYSFEYVATWGGGELEALTKSMDAIRRTAKEILGAA